jgi:hypothetical protein
MAGCEMRVFDAVYSQRYADGAGSVFWMAAMTWTGNERVKKKSDWCVTVYDHGRLA